MYSVYEGRIRSGINMPKDLTKIYKVNRSVQNLSFTEVLK